MQLSAPNDIRCRSRFISTLGILTCIWLFGMSSHLGTAYGQSLKQKTGKPSTSSPSDPRLAFHDDGEGNFVFNTGMVAGTVKKDGQSDTLKSMIFVDDKLPIDKDHGLLVPYRFLTPQKRYGFGSWEWPRTGELLKDGSIILRWAKSDDRPFEFSAAYAWKSADTMDMTIVFTPHVELNNFELFVGSYFQEFTKATAYVKDEGSAPTFAEATQNKGDVQLFPRDQAALKLVGDGRWTYPPFPNNWSIRSPLAAPVAVKRHPKSGATVIQMSPPGDCFAVSMSHPGHGAVYQSLFGKDLKKGQSVTGRIRMVFGRNLTDEQVVKEAKKYFDSQGEQKTSNSEPAKQPSPVRKAEPRKIPPGAKALGYTKCVIDERPVAEDVTKERTGNYKWFSGQHWMEQPTLDHYRNIRGKLAIGLHGCVVNNSRDMQPAKLPYLPGADGFYVEFDVQLSDNHKDHMPALFLMPREHSWSKEDHYPGDPEGFERWMELDVDEGGWGPGINGTVHSSTGISPNYKHEGNLNRLSDVPVERTKMNTFGAAYDPKRPAVSWWVNGKFMMEAGAPYVPEVAAKQNFLLIIAAQSHGKQVPYTMYLGGVRAFVPPTSKLPEADGPVIELKKNAGTLSVTVSEPDADLQVLTVEGKVEDTRRVEKNSESIVIDPGKHRLKVWKTGFHVFTQDFNVDAAGKKSITAKLAPVVKKLDSRSSTGNWNSPEFQKWFEEVFPMPPEQKLEAVSKKLMELNPGFYGKLARPNSWDSVPYINHFNEVVELAIDADYVSDISPVRVFGQLVWLKCVGSGPGKGYLSDLSPLKGMRMTHLDLWGTQVKDLSPLEGMPLNSLGLGHTPVSDLSQLKLASQSRWSPEPLKVNLYCDYTQVSDLSSLKELQLQSIIFTPKNIKSGIDVIRQMKSIETIGIDWQGKTTPDEFWKKYDAGEFRKLK